MPRTETVTAALHPNAVLVMRDICASLHGARREAAGTRSDVDAVH